MRELNSYNAAIYCRLSKDDDIRSGESSSIVSQRDILKRYVKDKGWHVHDYYIDDGFTGTNFNRPDFRRMIEDIEDGKVNCVITKDLSRLGRNYILTGQYTEIYFPSKSVRYIALNDGVDTLNQDNDIAPFKNILNEFYARDISNKVRSAVRARKLKGEYVNGLVPIGYRKDPHNKHRLLVEETGAAVVRRIFEMASADMGSKKIREVLNAEGVITPFNHYRKVFHGREPRPAKWADTTIIAVLRNRVYTGDTVQGIYECARFGQVPRKRRPKDEWIVTPNTHEPLVERETWELIQKKIDARNRPTRSGIVRLFSGLLKCEDCGYAMGYSDSQGKYAYYSCNEYRRHGSGFCTCHYINAAVLEQTVLDDIRKYAKLAKNKAEELARRIHEQNGDENVNKVKTLGAELDRLKARNAELDGIMKRLYEDNVSGKLSDERFSKFLTGYEKEQSDVQLRIENTERGIKEFKANQKDTDSWIKLIRNYTKIEELDRTVLCELVDKITVGEAKEIDGEKVTDVTIYYRFVGAVD